ncbi:MAG: EMC3/TMCO1 family protein [Nanoarchaeota archaeon]
MKKEMNKQGSMHKFMFWMMGFMLVGFLIIGLWNSVPVIKENVHKILDPSFGALLEWNLTIGMLIIVFILAFVMTLVQKYATDQETIKELKKEQKEVQKEMKKYQHDPKKAMEIQKSLMPTTFKLMELGMRGTIITIIPFILLFRWFLDYFSQPALESFRFLGFLSWFWFYLIFSIVFSSILRKVLKVH